MNEEHKLFVAGLPYSTNEDAVRKVFTESGLTVVDLAVPRDRMTGLARGFAFVTLKSAEEVNEARSKLDGRLLEGRPMRIRPFSSDPQAQRPDGGGRPERGGERHHSSGGIGGGDDSDRTLYLGNLPYEVTDVDVRGLFEKAQAPDPRQVTLPRNPDGKSRGFGFVIFHTADAATEALALVREPVIAGRRCVIHMATPRAARPSREDRFMAAMPQEPPSATSPKDEGRRRKSKVAKVAKKKKSGRSWDDDEFEGTEE